MSAALWPASFAVSPAVHFLGMIAAAIVTVIVLLGVGRLSLRLWLYALVILAGLGLVAWAGMAEKVQARLATLLDNKEVAEHSLIPHWRDAMGAAKDFWRTGSGLGTYRFAFLPHEHGYVPNLFYHAENQYVESLVVGGIGGLAMLLLAIGLVGRAAWSLLRRRSVHGAFALGVVGIFALSSQAFCAVADFGLYIPANALLLAILAGTVSGRAADAAAARDTSFAIALPGNRWAAPCSAWDC